MLGSISDVPAVIDESTVTDVTGTAGDENGVEDAFVDEFDAAAADCDGGAGVVAARNLTKRQNSISLF